MMPPFLTCCPIHPSLFLWKDELPSPLGRCIEVFSFQGIRHLHTPETCGQVNFMDPPNRLQVIFKRLFYLLGQHRQSILKSLAVPDDDLVGGEIDVLNPQPQAFH